MHKLQAPINDPGVFIANIPGVLGFYPHDSFVIAGFQSTEFPHRFALGPLVRLDLDDYDVIPEVFDKFWDYGVSLALGFIISQRSCEEMEIILEGVEETLASSSHCLFAVWQMTEILSDGEYHLSFGNESENFSRQWRYGRIGEITAAQSMASLVAEGMLPEITREDAMETIRRSERFLKQAETDALCLQVDTELGHIFRAHGMDVSSGLAVVGARRRDVVEQLAKGIISVEQIMASSEELLGLFVALSTKHSRDHFGLSLFSYPRAMADLMQAVACSVDGEIRHNALCLYALAYLELGLSSRALPALIAIEEEDPTHILGRLMLRMCQDGRAGELLISMQSVMAELEREER